MPDKPEALVRHDDLLPFNYFRWPSPPRYTHRETGHTALLRSRTGSLSLSTLMIDVAVSVLWGSMQHNPAQEREEKTEWEQRLTLSTKGQHRSQRGNVVDFPPKMSQSRILLRYRKDRG